MNNQHAYFNINKMLIVNEINVNNRVLSDENLISTYSVKICR